MSAHHPLSRLFVWAASSAAFSLVGCDDALKDASLIQETRVLGARVEVAGDPERGSPAPGEAAHLEFFVAAPSGTLNVAYALTLCGVAPTDNGFPPCTTAPLATTFQAEPSSEAPALDFQVPANLDRTKAPHGFASGVVCPNGAAQLTADGGANCANGPGDAVAFEFEFAGPGQDNENPNFTADSLTFDGSTWPASDAQAGCDALPRVHVKTEHGLGVQMQDGDFDALVQMNSADPTRETLLVSQFSDSGTLAHTFGSLDPSTPGLQSTASWSAPPSADANGAVVHFYFVVRDSRGGEDFATRAVCVVP